MNTDAIRRFLTFLSSAVKVERGQLYQLIQSAEASYYFRDIQSQHEIALLLQSFGYPFNQVGKYYESIYLYRSGQFEKARELLECVAELAPARYRSKALLSLAGVAERLGRFEESLRFRLQLSSCDDPVTFLEAQYSLAARRGMEGEHRAALRDLERFLPLAHIIGKCGHPAYVTFLNSYAVELCDYNRTEEAKQVANVIAASPFINRYPEWQETISEIASRRRRSSTIAVPHEYKANLRDPRVQAVISHMNVNLPRKLTLSELAGVAGLSRSHFARFFKVQTGIPPGEYLARLRMERARHLLLTSFLSIKQILAAVGYDTRSAFTHRFKRDFHLSPSEYRRRALKVVM
jgi:AraC-like DNA-binding protein